MRLLAYLAPILATLVLAPHAIAGATTAKDQLYELRLFAGAVDGKYRDHEHSEVLDRSTDLNGVKLTGTQVDLAGVYKSFELDVDYRSLTPSGVDYWTKRTELYLTFAYVWDMYPWVVPVLGLYQVSQAGSGIAAVGGPPAFIDRNKAFIIGARSIIVPLAFGEHGVAVQAHAYYLTTLEASRNFGTETDLAIGYVYSFGAHKIGLAFGQWRNFFNASRADPAEGDKVLNIRAVNISRHYGLYLQY